MSWKRDRILETTRYRLRLLQHHVRSCKGVTYLELDCCRIIDRSWKRVERWEMDYQVQQDPFMSWKGVTYLDLDCCRIIDRSWTRVKNYLVEIRRL